MKILKCMVIAGLISLITGSFLAGDSQLEKGRGLCSPRWLYLSKGTDADVSRAALRTLFPDSGSALVIEESTRSRPLRASWVSAELHDIPLDALDELVKSYLERNQEVAQFQAGLLPEGAQVVAAQEIEKMFADDMETGWKQFRQRYGDTAILVSLSLPGYALDRQSALIHVRRSRGPLAGESSILILRRVAQGDWQVVAEAQVAAS